MPKSALESIYSVPMPPSPRQSSGGLPHVLLLRGINVGGKNIVPMKALVRVVEGAGGSGVRTYIQSGNVVFSAPPKSVSVIGTRVSAAIAREFGLTVPVIVRSHEEMRRIATKNPFLARGASEEHLHIGFLSAAPTPARIRTLDPARSPADSFIVRGAEIYLHFPNGVSGTKLTSACLDSTLGTICTIRNWRTVLKLGDMMRAGV